MNSDRSISLLHVYSQYGPHDAVYIRGNRAGLLALRAAIDQAIEAGRADQDDDGDVTTADGECYCLDVRRWDDDWQEQEGPWRVGWPYQDDTYHHASRLAIEDADDLATPKFGDDAEPPRYRYVGPMGDLG